MTPIYYNDLNQPCFPPGYDPYKGMTDEERMTAGCLQGVALIVTVIVVMLLCALLGSCTTTKYVPVVEYHTDTLRLSSNIHDSIYVHDSTYTKENGDTVLIERWHTRWRDRWHSDTVYRARTDSVPYPVEVIKEVPAELTWWQKVRLYVGGIVIFLLIIFAGWKIYVTLHPRL